MYINKQLTTTDVAVEVDFLGSVAEEACWLLGLLLLDRDLLGLFLKPILQDFFRFCLVFSVLIISSCLLVIRPPFLTAKGGG